MTNTLGETADRVSGAGPEAFELLQEARQQKQGARAHFFCFFANFKGGEGGSLQWYV